VVAAGTGAPKQWKGGDIWSSRVESTTVLKSVAVVSELVTVSPRPVTAVVKDDGAAASGIVL